MASNNDLRHAHAQLREEAAQLAGGLTDLAQRATVYHHLFEHSGRNHIFPLIAAHGALWAKGYFQFGARLGSCLAWQHLLDGQQRRQRMHDLAVFADAFREVNRRVCVDTYTSYHFTRIHGDDPRAAHFVDKPLLAALNEMHAARRANVELSDVSRRGIFERFFLNEQEFVVGPSIAAAVDAFRWPAMKFIALKPVIRFAYFPGRRVLWFRNFADRDQRIANGLRAFDMGAAVGWCDVEQSLRHYDLLPSEFFTGSAEHFRTVRATVLA